MVSIKRTEQTLAAIVVLLFGISFMLKLAGGIDPGAALLDTVLSALQMVYSGIALTAANNNLVIVAKFLDALILPLLAVLLATIFAGVLGGFSLEERLSRGRVDKMKDHVIIVPFNSMARELAKGLRDEKIQSVVMVKNRKEMEEVAKAGMVGMIGDTDEPDSFSEAGIEKASFVVACSSDDSINAMTIMTARSIIPTMKTVSVVNDAENRDKMHGIRVNAFVTPELEAGRELAEMIVKNVFARPRLKE
jgi:voltage-gated potassium channel